MKNEVKEKKEIEMKLEETEKEMMVLAKEHDELKEKVSKENSEKVLDMEMKDQKIGELILEIAGIKEENIKN